MTESSKFSYEYQEGKEIHSKPDNTFIQNPFLSTFYETDPVLPLMIQRKGRNILYLKEPEAYWGKQITHNTEMKTQLLKHEEGEEYRESGNLDCLGDAIHSVFIVFNKY